MAKAIKKKILPGVGECGNPYCNEPKAPDRYLCAEHGAQADRIRQELEEDPKLLYHQRSDSPKREFEPKKPRKRVKECKHIGCFEIRVPGSPFCYEHEDEADIYEYS